MGQRLQPWLARWAPGLSAMAALDPASALRDAGAGLAVAAVGVPIGLAYAALMGVPAAVGLYASIAPVAVYALFGPSRRLVVGPDTATCTVLAAALTAVQLDRPEARAEAAAAAALLAGAGALVAAWLRLGAIAKLLSKPVLAGYLAGVAILLFLGQLSALTGVRLHQAAPVRMVLELVGRWREVQAPTLLLGIALFAALLAFQRFAPKWPGPALVVAAAILLSWALDLHRLGVAVLGGAPSGLPAPRLPHLPVGLERLAPAALTVLLVSFVNGVVTAKSFAGRGESIDPNAELTGLGLADLAAGVFQGFPVTGAASRTAVMLGSGGTGPFAALVGAVAIALVLLFLSAPLAWLPQAALGAVLASAALGMVDLKAFRRFVRVDTHELAFALATLAGVLWLGVIKGVVVGVALTLLHLIHVNARPRDAVLGRSPATGEWVTARRAPDAQSAPGGVVWLFEASVTFVNVDYFHERALAALDASPGARWFVLDGSAMTFADSAAVDALTDLKRALDDRGVGFALAGGHGLFRDVLARAGLIGVIGRDRLFDSPEAAVEALRTE